jgi:hypothetical protein
MTRRHIGQLAALATVGVIALSGCGGGSNDKSASAPAATTTTAAPVTTETTATTTTAAQTGGLTPIGSTLKMGQTAVIAYTDSSNHKKSNIEITPEGIEKGTLDDFKNIELDAAQKTATPFYVKLTVKNVGKGDLTGSDPGSYIDGVDDRGQEQSEVIFFGDFDRCNHDRPKSLKPGETYKPCLVYLIPKGGSIVGMRWIVFDQKTGKSNIEWK